MRQEVFTTAGSHAWTAPTGVDMVLVVLYGAGGDGGLDNATGGGGGGGAAVYTFVAVEEGEDYDVFVAAPGDDGSYFKDNTTALAKSGQAASGAVGGAGGSADDSIGGARWAGGAGTDSTGIGDGLGGGAGTTGEDGLGGGGAEPGDPPTFHGTGAGGGDSGAPGEVGVYWFHAGPAGCGGGGGGGYAKKTFAVTPGNTYNLHVGRFGLGQFGYVGSDETHTPLQHGENSWFISDADICGAGGNSVGNDDGDESALPIGALGGGQPGAVNANVGDETYPGGNGGNGNGMTAQYPFVGGGGGGAGGPDLDLLCCSDNHGKNGELNGSGGLSAVIGIKMFNTISRFTGMGGCGNDNFSQVGQDSPHYGNSGGGGGGGLPAVSELSDLGDFGFSGGFGRVRITGQRTGRLLIPNF